MFLRLAADLRDGLGPHVSLDHFPILSVLFKRLTKGESREMRPDGETVVQNETSQNKVEIPRLQRKCNAQKGKAIPFQVHNAKSTKGLLSFNVTTTIQKAADSSEPSPSSTGGEENIETTGRLQRNRENE